MKIVVLVKEVPDTYGERRLDLDTGLLDRSGDQVIDEINERALEVALLVKDQDKSTEVVVVSVGPDQVKDALRKKLLAMGADRAIHVVDDELAAADALKTARALTDAVRGESADLIVAGNESTDGRGGVVPAMVAEFLGLPLLGSLSEVRLTGAAVEGTRVDEEVEHLLSAPLPAVVTVTEKSAEARFPNFMGVMGAKKKPLEQQSAGELGSVGTVILSVAERPARAAGTIIEDEGDGGTKIAEYLKAQGLVK